MSVTVLEHRGARGLVAPQVEVLLNPVKCNCFRFLVTPLMSPRPTEDIDFLFLQVVFFSTPFGGVLLQCLASRSDSYVGIHRSFLVILSIPGSALLQKNVLLIALNVILGFRSPSFTPNSAVINVPIAWVERRFRIGGRA